MSAPAIDSSAIIHYCKQYFTAVGSKKLTPEQAEQAIELIALCNRAASSESLDSFKNKLVHVVHAHYQDSVSQKSGSVAASQLNSVNHLIKQSTDLISKLPEEMHPSGQKGVHIEALTSGHVQQMESILGQLKRCSSPDVDVYTAWFENVLLQAKSSPVVFANNVIDACQSYLENLPKLKHDSGQMGIHVDKLNSAQIKTAENLLVSLGRIPARPKNELAIQWKATLTSVVQNWKSLQTPSSSYTEAKFTVEYSALLDYFDLKQADRLLQKLEALPASEAVKSWKMMVNALVAENVKQQKATAGADAAKIAQNTKLLQEYKNPFEAPLPPVGIVNEGNTCFAAALLQLVGMNTLLSGAYRTLLPQNHYARKVLDSYQKQQQTKPSEALKGIKEMRAAFGSVSSKKQEDATELCFNINRSIEIPQSGLVDIGNNQRFAYGHFLQQYIEGDDAFRPYSVHQGSNVIEPMLDLKMNGKPAKLAELMNENMSHLYFSQSPNLMMLNIGRVKGVPLHKQTVDLPLFFQIPGVRKMADVPDDYYTLQGFLTHIGVENGGHYIAHHQWNGKFYKADDSRVTEVSQAEYLAAAKTAYLPIYSKVSKIN